MGKLIEIIDLLVNFYTYEGVVKALNKVSLSIDHAIPVYSEQFPEMLEIKKIIL